MKKLLTLFTLLLTVCSGAWAGDITITPTVTNKATTIAYGLFSITVGTGGGVDNSSVYKASSNGGSFNITFSSTKSDIYIKSITFNSLSNASLSSEDGPITDDVNFATTGNKSSVTINVSSTKSSSKGSVKITNVVVNTGANNVEVLSDFSVSESTINATAKMDGEPVTSSVSITTNGSTASDKILSITNNKAITITSESNITFIAFLDTDNKINNSNGFKVGNDKLTNGVWTGSEKSVTITNGTGSNRPIKNIYVITEAAAPTAPVLSLASSTDIPVLGDIVVKSDVAAAIVGGGSTVSAQIKDGETKVADVTGTLSGDRKTLTFENTTKLAYEKDYTLSIAADVLQNAADASLKNIAYNLNFTTAAKLSDVTMSNFTSTSFTTSPSTSDLSLAVSGSQFQDGTIKFRWNENSFTVTSAAHKIVAMKLTYTVEGEVTPVVNVSTGTFNLASKMWKGNASSVTFTNGYTASSAGNIYISSIKVYYEGSDEEPVAITIGSHGWTSLISDKNLNFKDIEGLNAYAAKRSGTTVTLNDVTEVDANKGIVLKGTASATYYVPVLASTEANVETDLTGSATVDYNKVGGMHYYVLANKSGVEGFYEYTGTAAIPKGKAFFETSSEIAGGKFSIVFADDETDGIKAVSTKVENGVRYNLAGQKVGADYKGIVIVNGKKYLNK